MNSSVPVEKFSISAALSFGWNKMKSYILLYIGIFIVAGITPLIPSVIAAGITRAIGLQEGNVAFTLISIVGTGLQTALNVLMSAGIIKISLDIVDNKAPQFSDLFSCFRLMWNYFAGSFLYGAIIFAGVLLLIVPAIIWSIQFQFYGYVVVDKGCGPIEALEKSSALTRGARWPLLGFALLLFGINLLGLLCFVVGLLVSSTITALAAAHVYKQLSAATLSAPGPPIQPSPISD